MCHGDMAPEPTEPVSSQASKRAVVAAEVPLDAEYFAGVIKSYNERRGFGFLACDETAQRFGRDVYLSKVESLAAIQEGEEPLKEGDHLMFAVVLSVEGFPQAAGAQRLHIVHGTVLNFTREQGATITCRTCEGAITFSAGEGAPPNEVIALPHDCGCLLLHPGDEVSFCIEDLADGSAPHAKLLRLVRTVRPASALLACFVLEFPRDAQNPVLLSGHAFSTCVCLSGIPTDIGEAKLTQFFNKVGAKHVTFAHSSTGSFANAVFAEVNDVTRFLAVENHSFTDQSNVEGATSLVRIAPSYGHGAQALPALSPPALFQGEAGGVLVIWEPVSLATAYKVEIRTAGAGGWSPVDAAGRVQPAGACPLLASQSTRLAIGGLSAGLPYEARVSYVASCGCHCIPSDVSCICTSGALGVAPSPPPMYGTPPVYGAPPVYGTHCAPCSPPGVPYSAEMHTGPIMALQAPPPPAPPPPPQDFTLAPQGTAAPMMQQLRAPPAPQFPYMYDAPLMQVHTAPVLQPPPQPEANVSPITNAISVRWSSYGIAAASYVVEVFDYIAAASNRFACQAPAESGSSLELCIQGLQPGQSYVACVRSVAQDGMESAPSPWSRTVTLPIMAQSFDPALTPVQHMPSPAGQPQQPVSPQGVPQMPSPAGQPQPPASPHGILSPQKLHETGQLQQPVSPQALFSPQKMHETPLEKLAGPPPEITGHEDTGLFLD
eukprot:gnl/MRDRNA2_/MRDRNA2_30087_c0_seq2.p1 gnl/MRDRNA2_/MRDRNA2_30087_c0~~gnl/MRDRNA2_/MRDRNA2_30087_c0_seq2.p1  ORF type:complete len:717 (+),score=130.32 gnl/MRDRNA2_/MRDRNA2_30087_c0_seq2:91-2241(+)